MGYYICGAEANNISQFCWKWNISLHFRVSTTGVDFSPVHTPHKINIQDFRIRNMFEPHIHEMGNMCHFYSQQNCKLFLSSVLKYKLTKPFEAWTNWWLIGKRFLLLWLLGDAVTNIHNDYLVGVMKELRIYSYHNFNPMHARVEQKNLIEFKI